MAESRSLVLLASLSLFLSLGLMACAGRPAMEDALGEIRRGMTVDEVEALLGEPDRVYDMKEFRPPPVLWGPGILISQPAWAYDWPHQGGRKTLVLRFYGRELVSYKVIRKD